MAGSSFGTIFKVTTFGESHGIGLGAVLDGCPAGLDIPYLVSIYNELSSLPSVTVSMRLENLPPEKLPSACVSCGACTQICPQKIDVPYVLTDLQKIVDKLPKWADICRERAASQK